MNKIKLISAFVLLFVVSAGNCFSQDFEYTYDNAGNRIKRQVISLLKSVEDSSAFSYSDINCTVTPNPTKDFIQVTMNDDKVTSNIEVFDLSGNLVETKTTSSGSSTLDFSGYANGTYIVRIHKGNKFREIKVVKD